MSDFWKRVDEELEYLGISRTYLANKCEFSLTNIGQGIKFGSTPSADTAVKIAKVLNVSVEYLVTGENQTLKNEGLDLKKFREYSSFLEKLDSLSENQKELVKSIVDKMADWKR